MKSMKCASVLVVMSAGAVSCIDEAYDLSNGIDTTVTVEGNISAPIGSTAFMQVGDFLSLDGENSSLVKDENGNYVLEIEGSGTSYEYTLPDVKVGNFLNSGERMEFNIDAPYDGIDLDGHSLSEFELPEGGYHIPADIVLFPDEIHSFTSEMKEIAIEIDEDHRSRMSARREEVSEPILPQGEIPLVGRLDLPLRGVGLPGDEPDDVGPGEGRALAPRASRAVPDVPVRGDGVRRLRPPHGGQPGGRPPAVVQAPQDGRHDTAGAPAGGRRAGGAVVGGGRQVPVPLPRRRARGEGGLPRVRGGAGPFQPRPARVGEVLRGDLGTVEI